MTEASTLEPADPVPGHEYVIGVDWGKLNDYTVITVLDAATREQVHIDRSNRVDYAFQLKRLHAIAERYAPREIVVERNSMGEPLLEQLQRSDLPRVRGFVTTNASKAAAIESLSLALEKGNLKLLNDATQVEELQAYEAQRLPSGAMRYGAPAGMHDDTVMALAIAHDAITNRKRMDLRDLRRAVGY